jgi:hypothetical protein
VVEIAKLQDYCLSTVHPEGRHKARVFYSVLGLGSRDAKELLARISHRWYGRRPYLVA